MSRTSARYRNPPVHEVVVDVVFEGAVEIANIEPLVEAVGKKFGEPQKVEVNSFEMVASPGMPPQIAASSELIGWKFELSGFPRWVLRFQRDRVTINMVRSDRWPKGSYIGWDLIKEQFEALMPSLSSVYGTRTTKRAGLRYLNRLAVPASEDLTVWLNIGARYPNQLKQPELLGLRQAWRSVAGFGGLGATVGLSRVDIADKELASSCTGLLLDIDVYNESPAVAPHFDALLSWYMNAHAAENMIFEACITDRARMQFRRDEYAAA